MYTKNDRSQPLYDHKTDEFIRTATPSEVARSREAAKYDGGIGVIGIEGRACYVGYGSLHDYETGEYIRRATADEADLARDPSRDGAECIRVDGRACYVVAD